MSLMDDDLMNDFLAESNENLDRLEQDLVVLEKEPANKETIASIFRTIHTMKGTSGFLGLGKLESVAHVGENLLSKVRDGQVAVSSDIISALLALMDALRKILNSIATTKTEGDTDYSSLIERLTVLQKTDGVPVAETPKDAPVKSISEPVVDALAPEPVREPVKAVAAVKADEAEKTTPPAAEAHGDHGTAGGDSTVRVNVALLDKLMNLVGELVLARNQILQFTATQEDVAFVATSQRLNLITTELQENIMKTRMQPINNIWNKLPRVVRDLAVACNKKVRIDMEGKETEVDRTLIESIKDPLTHLIRNSVDHGIEMPSARATMGKPEEGRILLRAYHEGGQVNIEISDDGGGINIEKIKAKVLQKGLMPADQLARMDERELINLIFLPGFSTAEKVTNVSGRGVGMDVVKTNIEKIGGTIDIQSRLGKGSTIRIKIPLTLAIIPALIVTSGGDRYAIPQVSLLELVRLEGEVAANGIEMVHGSPVYRLRGNLLPLVYLNEQLKVREEGALPHPVNIVVLQADERPFGLIVDEVNDTEEIVVKPLGKQLKGISLFAGATIMGDGRVALILDVLGMAQHSGVITRHKDKGMHGRLAPTQAVSANRQTLLLFNGANDERMAIPLSMVARLEEFDAHSIEKSMETEVVQYRKQIMPLVRLAHLLPESGLAKAPGSMVQVVVYSQQGKSVGLVVDKILDIVEEDAVLEKVSGRPGVMGSAVIQGRVTDLIDVPRAIAELDTKVLKAAA